MIWNFTQLECSRSQSTRNLPAAFHFLTDEGFPIFKWSALEPQSLQIQGLHSKPQLGPRPRWACQSRCTLWVHQKAMHWQNCMHICTISRPRSSEHVPVQVAAPTATTEEIIVRCLWASNTKERSYRLWWWCRVLTTNKYQQVCSSCTFEVHWNIFIELAKVSQFQPFRQWLQIVFLQGEKQISEQAGNRNSVRTVLFVLCPSKPSR